MKHSQRIGITVRVNSIPERYLESTFWFELCQSKVKSHYKMISSKVFHDLCRLNLQNILLANFHNTCYVSSQNGVEHFLVSFVTTEHVCRPIKSDGFKDGLVTYR